MLVSDRGNFIRGKPRYVARVQRERFAPPAAGYDQLFDLLVRGGRRFRLRGARYRRCRQRQREQRSGCHP